MQAYCMWFVAICAIALAKKEGFSFNVHFLKVWFVIAILPSIFIIVSLFYSEHFSEGLSPIQTKLGLVIIPLVIFMTRPLEKSEIIKFYKWVLWLFVPIFFYDIIRLIIQNYQLNGLESIQWKIFQYHSLSSYLGIHSIYLSVVVAIILLFAIDAFITKKITIKALVFFIIPLLLAFLFSLAAKMVIAAFLASLFFYFFLHSINNRLRPKLILVILLALTFMGLIILQNDSVKKRFQVAWQVQNVQRGLDYSKDAWGSFELRFALMYSSWEAVKKDWLLGTGIGDVRFAQNEAYESKNFQFAIDQGFNSHNQYIDTWIAAGLPGLLSLIFSLLFSLYMAIRYKYSLFGAFILLYILVLITENHFDRLHGVSTFAFFFAFLIRNAKVIGNTKKGFSLN